MKAPWCINFDRDPKSDFYWMPCGLLNNLMVLSAVNEGRLLIVTILILMKLLLSGGEFLNMKVPVSNNYDCDGKSPSK